MLSSQQVQPNQVLQHNDDSPVDLPVSSWPFPQIRTGPTCCKTSKDHLAGQLHIPGCPASFAMLSLRTVRATQSQKLDFRD
jgi:hypothetical protein